jgi:hypothetical protein
LLIIPFRHLSFLKYKVVQIWPEQTGTCLHTISPGHIWTTLYHDCISAEGSEIQMKAIPLISQTFQENTDRLRYKCSSFPIPRALHAVPFYLLLSRRHSLNYEKATNFITDFH